MLFYFQLILPVMSSSTANDKKNYVKGLAGSGSGKKTTIDASNPYADLFASHPPYPSGNSESKTVSNPDQSNEQLRHSTLYVEPINKAPAKPAVSLLFKPRQTSISSSCSSSKQERASASASTNQALHAPDARPAAHTLTAPSGRASPTQQVEAAESKQEGGQEGCEAFNANDSFDVPHPYDPRRPNDYLALLEEREERKRLAKLEEENRRKMGEMERARQDLERQRKEAAEKKDYQKLLETSSGLSSGSMSRGRGRGMVNLPAWLTQQMEDQELAGGQNNPSNDQQSFPPVNNSDSYKYGESAEDRGSQTSGVKRKASAVTKPSTVLLLLNLLSLSEALADTSFAAETKEECEKYGPVKECQVLLAKPQDFPHCAEEERVRFFVHFERQDSAVKAFKDLHGRYFGGRPVTAIFFDEGKFKRKQLEPED